MKSENVVITTILIFFGGMILGSRLTLSDPRFTELLGDLLIPLVAAFLGAFLAFKLQESHERRKDRRKQVDAINQVLLGLIRQWIAINGYKFCFEEYETDPLRFVNLPGYQTKEAENVTLNIESIGFLSTAGYSDFLIVLVDEQMRYDQIIQSISKHYQLSNEELRPAMRAAGIAYTTLTMNQLLANLDPILVDKMRSITNHLFASVWRSHESLDSAMELLRSIGSELYPEEHFIPLDKSQVTPE